MAESEEELESLVKVKEESEKAGLKFNIQKTKIMAYVPITISHTANRWRNNGNSERIFLRLQNHCRWYCSHEIKMHAPWKKSYDQPRQHIKRQRHYFADKGLSQSYSFSSSQVWMWELDHKENWALKKSCFWTMLLERTLESPLDCKKIKAINPKGYQSEYSLKGLMLKF